MSKAPLNTAYDNAAFTYLILNAQAPCKPVQKYFADEVWADKNDASIEARPLWNGTEYSEWLALSPYLARVTHHHPFIDWLNEQEDWGFAALSSYDFKSVYQHLQSLTQVWMPNGFHAFFKFWQPSVSFKIFDLLPNQPLHELMGPCSAFMIKDKVFYNPIESPYFTLHDDFPWWEVPKPVSNMLFTETPELFVTNMMTWIKDNRDDLYERFGDNILKAKLSAYHRLYIQKARQINKEIAPVIQFIEG